jgi:hypothetical protein
LNNILSDTEDALMMMEKYPAALRQPIYSGDLPLHIECINRCRSAVITRCIELYPEALAAANDDGSMPLHLLLNRRRSDIKDALIMIEKYPAALKHPNRDEELPLCVECSNRCRSAIISKCIELYPEALSKTDFNRYLPLHWLLENDFSTIEDALMMIEKYPSALQHQNWLAIFRFTPNVIVSAGHPSFQNASSSTRSRSMIKQYF